MGGEINQMVMYFFFCVPVCLVCDVVFFFLMLKLKSLGVDPVATAYNLVAGFACIGGGVAAILVILHLCGSFAQLFIMIGGGLAVAAGVVHLMNFIYCNAKLPPSEKKFPPKRSDILSSIIALSNVDQTSNKTRETKLKKKPKVIESKPLEPSEPSEPSKPVKPSKEKKKSKQSKSDAISKDTDKAAELVKNIEFPSTSKMAVPIKPECKKKKRWWKCPVCRRTNRLQKNKTKPPPQPKPLPKPKLKKEIKNKPKEEPKKKPKEKKPKTKSKKKTCKCCLRKAPPPKKKPWWQIDCLNKLKNQLDPCRDLRKKVAKTAPPSPGPSKKVKENKPKENKTKENKSERNKPEEKKPKEKKPKKEKSKEKPDDKKSKKRFCKCCLRQPKPKLMVSGDKACHCKRNAETSTASSSPAKKTKKEVKIQEPQSSKKQKKASPIKKDKKPKGKCSKCCLRKSPPPPSPSKNKKPWWKCDALDKFTKKVEPEDPCKTTPSSSGPSKKTKQKSLTPSSSPKPSKKTKRSASK